MVIQLLGQQVSLGGEESGAELTPGHLLPSVPGHLLHIDSKGFGVAVAVVNQELNSNCKLLEK